MDATSIRGLHLYEIIGSVLHCRASVVGPSWPRICVLPYSGRGIRLRALCNQARPRRAGDGAASSTRQQLGIAWEGTSDLQHLINIHFRSAKLAQHLRAAPAMLYFVFSPRAIVVLVAHDLRIGAPPHGLRCAHRTPTLPMSG